MFDPLNIPLELQHLLEKREQQDRRIGKRRKSIERRVACATDEATRKLPEDPAGTFQERRSGRDRRKNKNRRRMVRRRPDTRKRSGQ